MNLYAESSAVLTYLLAEPRRDEVLEILLDAETILTSDLTLVECSRVIRRVAREKDLEEEETQHRLSILDELVEDWNVFRLDQSVIATARGPFGGDLIRTLDALHVASALEASKRYSDCAILTLDKRTRQVARLSGLDLRPV